LKANNSYNPLVSVIINSHNGGNFLNQSIKSVLEQTYKNFEIIFYDNFSSDDSVLKIKKINSKKIKYYYSKKFLKLYHARDLAVKKAKGELIAFLDVDDWWERKKLEAQIKVFRKSIVILSYTNYKIHDEQNKTIKTAFKNLPDGLITDRLLKKNFIGMCTLMFRRKSYFELKKGFDHKFEIIGDYDLCLRLSINQLAKSINQCLSHYRWHPNNLSNTKRKLNFLELIRWVKKNKKFKKFSNFKHLENFSNFQLGLSLILDNKKIKTIKILKKLNFYYRIKLFLLIMMPIKLIKVLKNTKF
jgi:glycosyltransferase involved in cell wall biosynthesis